MAKNKNMQVELDGVESIIKNQHNDTTTHVDSDKHVHVETNVSTKVQKTEVTQVPTAKIKAQRTNGSTYYIEDFLRKKMKLTSALNGIDLQNIVRASVDYFYSQYEAKDGMGLTDKGIEIINNYLNRMNQRAANK